MERGIGLRDIISERVRGVTYDSMMTSESNMPKVYQVTFKDRLPSIFKYGFSREYAASAGGNYYCTGLYTTFSLSSSKDNLRTKHGLYGDCLLQMYVSSFDRFFIANKDLAIKTYGEKYRLADQIEYLFKDWPDKLQSIKNSRLYGRIVNENEYYTSNNVVAFLEEMGGMRRACDPQLAKYDIRGFIFRGSNDGKVALIRDFKAIIPYSFSVDTGKTWSTELFSQDTLDFSANDDDPIIFLGADEKKYVNPTKYRVINGYMRVQRKSDKKYNFLDGETKEVISPLWFDTASDFADNGRAVVQSGGETFYIDNQGFYENEDDEYPFELFSEYEP